MNLAEDSAAGSSSTIAQASPQGSRSKISQGAWGDSFFRDRRKNADGILWPAVKSTAYRLKTWRHEVLGITSVEDYKQPGTADLLAQTGSRF